MRYRISKHPWVPSTVLEFADRNGNVLENRPTLLKLVVHCFTAAVWSIFLDMDILYRNQVKTKLSHGLRPKKSHM